MSVVFGRLPGGPVIATILAPSLLQSVVHHSGYGGGVGNLMIPTLKKRLSELMNVGAVC